VIEELKTSDALVVNFGKIPKEFIAQTNHQSPYKIEGVAKATLIKDHQQQCLLIYRVYGVLNGMPVSLETYSYVRQLFRDLGELPAPPRPQNYDLSLNDNELRLNSGLEVLQDKLRRARYGLRNYSGIGVDDAIEAIDTLEVMVGNLLAGGNI
jgi:hypothetical protein